MLDRPAVEGVLVWRWFTDPAAGGAADTDFTVQGKPAERVFACARTRAAECAGNESSLLEPVPDAEHQAVLLQRVAAGDRW